MQPPALRRFTTKTLVCALLTLVTAAAGLTPLNAQAATKHHGQNQWVCHGKRTCVSSPHGLKVHFGRKTGWAIVTGWGWKADRAVVLRFADAALQPTAATRPGHEAISGVRLRTDVHGRFRVLLRGEFVCYLTAKITAGYPKQSVETITPRPRCMEGRSPNPPPQQFRVTVGAFGRTVLARSGWKSRYVLQLQKAGTSHRRVTRKQAIAIARANSGSATPTTISLSRWGRAAAGNAAWRFEDMWEIVLNHVTVPEYHNKREVVLIHGRHLIASWYAA
jgi:hypothetical protein